VKHTNIRRDWCAVLFALVFPTLITVVYFILLARYSATVQLAAGAAGKLVQFVFPAVWFTCIQRGQLAWPSPKRADLLLAGGLGVVLVAAALALYQFQLKPAGFFSDAVIEAVRGKVGGFGVASGPRYATLALLYVVIHSWLEEYYWRWFVFGQLRRLTSLPLAIGVSSLGFMAHHVCIVSVFFGWFSPTSIGLSLAVAAGGAIWAWLYHRTGSLWGPWISHALVDAGIFVIGYDLVM
jgi:membrane protease YdiL (CAAX protease family)